MWFVSVAFALWQHQARISEKARPCRSCQALVNQGQEKLAVVTLLWFLSVKWSQHDGVGRQHRSASHCSWWAQSRTSKALPDLHRCCLTGGLLPGWPQPPKLQAWSQKPQAETWEQQLLLTHCLRVMYVIHTVWRGGIRAEYLGFRWQNN